MLTGSATILRADARSLPLADASVDLVVTSPPYFALRSYTDRGEHYAGQIGAEATPQEYIAALIDCTREWMRVLKPGGSIWVNLGDKYAGVTDGRNNNGYGGGSIAATHSQPAISDRESAAGKRFRVSFGGVRTKSLLLVPERYRIACVDELGLIARAVVVWSKPNGLPESVTDRVRRSHEDWVHLTKQPRYFSAVDEIRQPPANPGKNYGANGAGSTALRARNTSIDKEAAPYAGPNSLGALPGSVWEIATEPLTVPDHLGVDHFAAFPTEWPRRIILGWSPSAICVECGEGRKPIVTAQRMMDGQPRDDLPAWADSAAPRRTPNGAGHGRFSTHRRRVGETCGCPDTAASTRSAVVLDPFGGTGTTALVAKVLGRHGISVDRSADYCRLAAWRTTDPGQLAKAMRVEKPAVQLDGQADLLAELGEAS